jgi:hypothetical protein
MFPLHIPLQLGSLTMPCNIWHHMAIFVANKPALLCCPKQSHNGYAITQANDNK